MPLIYQKRIVRQDLKDNPEWRYVFGDNVARKGMGGQAGQMRGEPNAIGVVTKWRPSNDPGAFFYESQMGEILNIMLADLHKVHEALIEGRTVVWPSDGIGSGLSRLPQTAPKLWDFLWKTRIWFEHVNPKEARTR